MAAQMTLPAFRQCGSGCRPSGRAFGSRPVRRALAVCASTNGSGKVVLEVKDLQAKIAATGEQILKGVNLTVREGEVHAVVQRFTTVCDVDPEMVLGAALFAKVRSAMVHAHLTAGGCCCLPDRSGATHGAV